MIRLLMQLNPPPSLRPVQAGGREARKRNPSITSRPIWVEPYKYATSLNGNNARLPLFLLPIHPFHSPRSKRPMGNHRRSERMRESVRAGERAKEDVIMDHGGDSGIFVINRQPPVTVA